VSTFWIVYLGSALPAFALGWVGRSFVAEQQRRARVGREIARSMRLHPSSQPRHFRVLP
jgi:hypothetical protein